MANITIRAFFFHLYNVLHHTYTPYTIHGNSLLTKGKGSLSKMFAMSLWKKELNWRTYHIFKLTNISNSPYMALKLKQWSMPFYGNVLYDIVRTLLYIVFYFSLIYYTVMADTRWHLLGLVVSSFISKVLPICHILLYTSCHCSSVFFD